MQKAKQTSEILVCVIPESSLLNTNQLTILQKHNYFQSASVTTPTPNSSLCNQSMSSHSITYSSWLITIYITGISYAELSALDV